MDEQQFISTQISRILQRIDEIINSVALDFGKKLLSHEEDFMKAYRLKMREVHTLFEDFKQRTDKSQAQDRLKERIELISKERDYFRFQCFKLNDSLKDMMQQKKVMRNKIDNLESENDIYRKLIEKEKLKNGKIVRRLKSAEKQRDIENGTVDRAVPLQQRPISNQKDRTHNSSMIGLGLKKNSKALINMPGMPFKLIAQDVNDSHKNNNNNMNFIHQRIFTASNKKNYEQMQDKNIKKLQIDGQRRELFQVFKKCVEAVKIEIGRRKQKHPRLFVDVSKISLEDFRKMDKQLVIKSLLESAEFLQFIEKSIFQDFLKRPRNVHEPGNSSKKVTVEESALPTKV